MKKLMGILLALVILLTLLPVMAEDELSPELLVNPGFETGTSDGWFSYGQPSTATVNSAQAHTGSYGLKLSGRKHKYATYAQDVTDNVTRMGPGRYVAEVWVRSETPNDVNMAQLVVNYRTLTGDKDQYLTSARVALTDSWQKLTINTDLNYDVEEGLQHVYIYVQTFANDDSAGDEVMDDFSLKKNGEATGEEPLTPISTAGNVRPEKTTFGAIRWDAWYTHDGAGGSVVSQVERSLSPAHYHFRAPFFASVTNENKIQMPRYTQQIFDKEMRYAMEAHVDYFAYVWYNTDMKMARKFHETSVYRNAVKLCVCFDGNAIAQSFARREMEYLFLQDYYMTVLDGRPLMYYFGSGSSESMNKIREDIRYYRQLCTRLGLPMPYAVIMNTSADTARAVGGDAVSTYAIGGSNGMSFESLTNSSHNSWESWRSSGLDYVPCVTFGWHAVPRYENPVAWTSVPSNSWAQYATADECASSVSYALSYMKRDNVKNQTKPNTVLSYAWNEHDEGGWFCPTIKVDSDGQQIIGENGVPGINDSRLRAIQGVLTEGEDPVVVGDTTNDASVDAADLTKLARVIARIDQDEERDVLLGADMNEDALINAADLTSLARKVARID